MFCSVFFDLVFRSVFFGLSVFCSFHHKVYICFALVFSVHLVMRFFWGLVFSVLLIQIFFAQCFFITKNKEGKRKSIVVDGCVFPREKTVYLT